MRWWVTAALVVTLVPRGALAQAPAAFELQWQAPAGCPAGSDVQHEVEQLLGDTTGTFVDAKARVKAARGGYELSLVLEQNQQLRERGLSAPSCAELGHAAALVLALAINPALQNAPIAAPPAPPEPPPCPPVEAPPAPAPPLCPRCASCPAPVIPKPPRPWRFAALATTSVAYGELPRMTPRPELGASYRFDAHTLELSFGAAFANVPRGNSRVATFSQWFAAPRYCLSAESEQFRFGGCASVEIGWVRAAGFGVAAPNSGRALWLAPGLGAQANWKLAAGAELVLGADLLVSAQRQRFVLDEDQVFRTHLLTPAIRLGVLAGL